MLFPSGMSKIFIPDSLVLTLFVSDTTFRPSTNPGNQYSEIRCIDRLYLAKGLLLLHEEESTSATRFFPTTMTSTRSWRDRRSRLKHLAQT